MTGVGSVDCRLVDLAVWFGVFLVKKGVGRFCLKVGFGRGLVCLVTW